MISVIKNGAGLCGRVRMPPSKSETIRAALLLALAGEEPEEALAGYEGFSVCDDSAAAVSAARALKRGECGLYAGASAALFRMIVPVCLALFGQARVTAEPGLLARGHAELWEAAGVTPEAENGVITVKKRLVPGRYRVDCSRSSQFLSGLLLALPMLEGDSEIELAGAPVSLGYADMTLSYARAFGAEFDTMHIGPDTRLVRVRSSPYRRAEPFYNIDGRPAYASGAHSYAAFFHAANAMGGSVEICGLDSAALQPDAAFPHLVGRSGVSLAHVPDLLPPLAAAACARQGATVFRDTARLAYKESKRPQVMARLIRDLGGEAEAGEDSMTVYGGAGLKGGECFPEADHRIAMAAAMLAPLCTGPVILHDAECVSKSAPDFWRDYGKIGGEYEFVRE